MATPPKWTGPYALTAAQRSERARKVAERVRAALRRGVGKGMKGAVLFLAARLKEEVGLPAPRRKVTAGGAPSWRATTRAEPRAPPRKVSGALQRSVQVVAERFRPGRAVLTVNARSAGGFPYPLFLETGAADVSARNVVRLLGKGRHPFVQPVLDRHMRQLVRVFLQGFRPG
jgi:hypothetical protein